MASDSLNTSSAMRTILHLALAAIAFGATAFPACAAAPPNIVLFLTDNGAHGPSPNQGGPYPGDFGPLLVGNSNLPLRGLKSGVYEGGIRTPGVAHWPGQLAPGEIHMPLHAVDWTPTLCALAGAKPAGDLKWDGANIWPVLTRQEKSPAPRTIYSSGTGFRSAALRHGDWKLIIHRPDAAKKGTKALGSEELFNLAADPGETKNLAVSARPASRSVGPGHADQFLYRGDRAFG